MHNESFKTCRGRLAGANWSQVLRLQVEGQELGIDPRELRLRLRNAPQDGEEFPLQVIHWVPSGKRLHSY
jgi:hypothetical protein